MVWKKRNQRLDKGLIKIPDAILRVLRKELQVWNDAKIKERLAASDKKTDTRIENTEKLAEEARAAAEQAKAALRCGAAGAGPTAPWGATPSGPTGGRWVPKTVEMKGVCSSDQRYTM